MRVPKDMYKLKAQLKAIKYHEYYSLKKEENAGIIVSMCFFGCMLILLLAITFG